MYKGNNIFVFGSNQAGRHGKGAALFANKHCGAVYGRGEGLFGNSYAIPTKDFDIQTLPLDKIAEGVERFKVYVNNHPSLIFHITPIGCGLAGYSKRDIWPLFKGLPSNCVFTSSWNE